MERLLQMHWWGELDYASAVREQESLRDTVIEQGGGAHLVIVEHPQVVTCGRNYTVSDLEKKSILERGFGFEESSRGGKLTYHGPGQLVMYPIVHLAWARVGVKGIVRGVIDSMGRWLDGQGISTKWNDSAPGLWTDGSSPKKIASVGMRITRGVSWHGAALNLRTDLSAFSAFQPCGFSGSMMTSVLNELGESPTIQVAAEGIATEFASLLNLVPVSSTDRGDGAT